jgi:hypothetical protein
MEHGKAPAPALGLRQIKYKRPMRDSELRGPLIHTR